MVLEDFVGIRLRLIEEVPALLHWQLSHTSYVLINLFIYNLSGFSKLESNRGQYAKFMIKPLEFKNENCFPIAHTCFNRLELPKYPKEDMMRKCLRGIVLNDLEGIFGME